MQPESFLKEVEGVVRALVQRLKEDLRAIRSNRPSVELVENIQVSYYDQMMPIRQLGSLSVQPPRDVVITVWDKNAMGPIMKAIQDAKIGLTVSNDEQNIRASLPPLTNERREELSKVVKKAVEQLRIQLRSRRDEFMKEVKSAEDQKELNEDQMFKLKEKVQKHIDEGNKEIEALLESKLKELSE